MRLGAGVAQGGLCRFCDGQRDRQLGPAPRLSRAAFSTGHGQGARALPCSAPAAWLGGCFSEVLLPGPRCAAAPCPSVLHKAVQSEPLPQLGQLWPGVLLKKGCVCVGKGEQFKRFIPMHLFEITLTILNES